MDIHTGSVLLAIAQAHRNERATDPHHQRRAAVALRSARQTPSGRVPRRRWWWWLVHGFGAGPGVKPTVTR